MISMTNRADARIACLNMAWVISKEWEEIEPIYEQFYCMCLFEDYNLEVL